MRLNNINHIKQHHEHATVAAEQRLELAYSNEALFMVPRKIGYNKQVADRAKKPSLHWKDWCYKHIINNICGLCNSSTVLHNRGFIIYMATLIYMNLKCLINWTKLWDNDKLIPAHLPSIKLLNISVNCSSFHIWTQVDKCNTLLFNL